MKPIRASTLIQTARILIARIMRVHKPPACAKELVMMLRCDGRRKDAKDAIDLGSGCFTQHSFDLRHTSN